MKKSLKGGRNEIISKRKKEEAVNVLWTHDEKKEVVHLATTGGN